MLKLWAADGSQSDLGDIPEPVEIRRFSRGRQDATDWLKSQLDSHPSSLEP